MRRNLARLCVVALMASAVGVISVVGAGPAGAAPTAIMTVFTFTEVEEDATCAIVSVDLGTGTTSPLSSRDDEGCPIDYAPRADGQIFGVTLTGFSLAEPSRLVTVDAATGAMTDVGSTGVAFVDIGALEFDAAGTLWMAGEAAGEPECVAAICLFQIDPTSGAATFAGTFDTPVGAIAFLGGMTRTCTDPLYTNHTELVPPGEAPASGETDATTGDTEAGGETETAPTDQDLNYLGPSADVGAAQVGEGTLATLDTATPAFNDIGPLGDSEFAAGLAFANDGVLWGHVLDDFFVEQRTYSTGTIDPATGAFSKVATLDVSDTETESNTPSGLTFLPDPCAAPQVVLEPTFTG